MKKLCLFLGIVSLVFVILPPALFMLGVGLGESLMKALMLAGTVVWFLTAPVWMRKSGEA